MDFEGKALETMDKSPNPSAVQPGFRRMNAIPALKVNKLQSEQSNNESKI